MASKAKRPTVNCLHDDGIAQAEIARMPSIPLSKVCRQIKRYEELGTAEDRRRSGRPVTACTPANREKIRHRINHYPERSMRQMAKELGICEKSVRKVVKTQLGYRSYKLRKGQLLTKRMKAHRLQKARKLKRIVAAGRHRSVLSPMRRFSLSSAIIIIKTTGNYCERARPSPQPSHEAIYRHL